MLAHGHIYPSVRLPQSSYGSWLSELNNSHVTHPPSSFLSVTAHDFIWVSLYSKDSSHL